MKIVTAAAALSLALLASPANAKTTCNMAGMKSLIAPRIKQMLAGVYTLNGKTLDVSKISISQDKNGIYGCTSTRPAPDQPGYVFCDGNDTFESLDVSFVSPTGTRLVLSTEDQNPPTMGFSFEVHTQRDDEGKPLGSTCGVSATIVDYSEKGFQIYNPTEKVPVTLSENLDKSLPGASDSLRSLVSFEAPMN